MPTYNSAELARICRQQAGMTSHEATKEVLLKMAERYDDEHDRENQANVRTGTEQDS